MESEIIMLTSIQQPDKMRHICSLDHARQVIVDGLKVTPSQLNSYFAPFQCILLSKITDSHCIEIQELFEVLDDPSYWRSVGTVNSI